MIFFKKQCVNCEEYVLQKRFNFCTNCGYPTRKKLREVENPDELIKRQMLTIPECASNSVRVHGLIKTMQKMGYMTIDECDELVSKTKESFRDLLNLIE